MIKRIFIGLAVFLIIFGVYQNDALKTIQNEITMRETYAAKPADFSTDSESLILGSLLEMQMYRFTAGLGRLARVNIPTDNWYENVQYTYKYYLESTPEKIKILERYYSQLGGQSIIFRTFEYFMNGEEGAIKLETMHTFNLIVLSFLFALFIVVAYREFGKLAALFGLLSLLFTYWLVLASVNLYWVIWTWYLPFVISWVYFLSYRNPFSGKKYGTYLALLFLSVAFKSSSGFEFISTVLVAAVLPAVYHLVKYEILLWPSIQRLFQISVVAVSGFFTIVGLQLLFWKKDFGSWSAAFDLMKGTIIKRTYGNMMEIFGTTNPTIQQALDTPLLEVLRKYLNANTLVILAGSKFIEIKFYQILIAATLLVTMITLILKKRNFSWTGKLKAMLVMTMVASLAPLSWFVLAKGHAAAHIHIDPILWYVPFIPLIFICIGYLTSQLLNSRN